MKNGFEIVPVGRKIKSGEKFHWKIEINSIPVVQIYIRHAFTECVNLVSDVNRVSIRAMITLQVKMIVLNFQYDKICDCRKMKIKI